MQPHQQMVKSLGNIHSRWTLHRCMPTGTLSIMTTCANTVYSIALYGHRLGVTSVCSCMRSTAQAVVEPTDSVCAKNAVICIATAAPNDNYTVANCSPVFDVHGTRLLLGVVVRLASRLQTRWRLLQRLIHTPALGGVHPLPPTAEDGGAMLWVQYAATECTIVLLLYVASCKDTAECMTPKTMSEWNAAALPLYLPGIQKVCWMCQKAGNSP